MKRAPGCFSGGVLIWLAGIMGGGMGWAIGAAINNSIIHNSWIGIALSSSLAFVIGLAGEFIVFMVLILYDDKGLD